MTEINSLRDIIQFNSNFKTAINLYLSLNKAEKVLGYIPTKSSVSFLGEYLKAVLENKEQATLLVGPYGKGKSHLLLVLLAVLSMERTPESKSVINELIDKVSKTDEVGERVSEYIGQVWDKKRFLPVLITDTTGDLNQAFLYGLNDALKRDRLLDLAPETYYSIALDRIDDWEQNYFETYKMFERELTQNGMNIAELKTDLKQYSQKALILFKEIYPKVTAGSEFNPMALSDALSLYKSVSEKLVDEYGYSGIYIVFDEFSKFIEGQNNTAAGTNMHLLQSMCELATDSKNAQVFITMVTHKSIDEINRYVDSCCDKKAAVKEMVYKLVKAPYGMRTGVIPFYLAYVLANRREDIIVYFLNKEVQITSEIVVNMCEQPEDYAIYVSKEDLQKEKYISELNMLFEVEDNRNLSSNRIKDIIICMQRWFRSLQQATRNVICLDQYVDNDNMVQAMKTIKKAMQKVEFNPFEILFVEFPEAFRTDSLEETFKVIDDCKTCYDDYFRWIEEQAITAIYGLWDRKRKQDLYHTLKEWYDKQSKRSKMGLYDGRMTNFMSCLEGLDVYSDQDVASKVVKAVTDVYMENWNTGSLEEFIEALTSVKNEVESIREDSASGELELKFIGRNGETIKKLYSYANEDTGSILRNIIEDTLDEYDDLSINDRVSILLEMIEKIIK